MSWSRKGIHFTLLFAALILLTCFEAKSQNLRKIEREATSHFNDGNFVLARDQFIILQKADWNENMTSSFLASCYLEMDEPLKAFEVLSKVSDPDPANNYLMILTYYNLENFEEADRLIKDFQDTAGFDIQSMSERVSRAQSSYNNNRGILIQNFGSEINSENLEYSAVMYNDYNKLLYTSRKEDGEITDVDGLAFETIYYTALDSTHNWLKARPFNVEVKQQRSHDATVQVYGSGDKIILYHDGQLYIATLKGDMWSKNENLILHEKGGSDTHCFITSDEKTIFFASDYFSDGEHLDLYVSQENAEGHWSEPKPLTQFNTELDEDSPFLANDSTFYFSSNGHNSMGGYDVFKSTYDPVRKEWGAPVNMEFPINTVADDLYYTTEGKLGYLSSNRLGGYGSLDLYRVFLFNRVRVQGRLLDDQQQPIPDAEIDIKYEDTILKSYTDVNGDYELFVPVNTKMHITFIKDSLNLFEGEYIANISFEDQNHNEFNFFIDYLSAEPERINGKEDNQIVRHMNIAVRNDNKKNPIIASVPEKLEDKWSDSLNRIAKELKTAELEKRELSIASKKSEGNVDIQSDHLLIRDATIREKPINRLTISSGENINTIGRQRSSKGTYTVQILAMSRLKPDKTYFDKLEEANISNADGKDGLNRFYTGKYRSFEEALEAMRLLRKAGYRDAFIRRLEKYGSL